MNESYEPSGSMAHFRASPLFTMLLASVWVVIAGCGGGQAATKTAAAATASASAASAAAASAAAATAAASASAAAAAAADATSYRSLAANMSGTAGVEHRFGLPSMLPDTGLPTHYKPDDKHYDNHGNGAGWDYEVGGPQDLNKNDYGSNQAQLLYIPDDSTDPGMDVVIQSYMGEGTFSEKPQLPWVYYGGGHPDVGIVYNKDHIATNGGPISKPVAVGRGQCCWAANDLVAFQSGLIAAFGTNTSLGQASIKLPANKVPTAVAVTSNNEFALITVWDTTALKGQVAVLALGAGNGFWGDWTVNYPGLRNHAVWSFIKLLGYVDLPGMTRPTQISASVNTVYEGDPGWLRSPDGGPGDYRFQLSQLTLDDEVNRQSFIGNGPNSSNLAKSGFAVVGSRADKKAIVMDLTPLFAKTQQMYFTSRANFVKTKDTGYAPTQWPYTFDVAPDFAPTVVKTFAYDQAVTAVRASLPKNPVPGMNQVYVATEEGSMHIITVGGYGDATGGTPDKVTEIGKMQVGANPTSIAQSKHPEPWATQQADLIVVSRAERAIRWIKMTGATGTVLKTLRDSRLKDPIWAEDTDNHGTEHYLLTVADYSGKQVANYRYGPVIFHTNGGESFGMGADGKADFEFGGTYPMPGRPFQLSGNNVP